MSQMSGIGASPGVAIGPISTVSQDRWVVLPSYDDPAAAMAQAMTDVGADLAGLSTRAADAGREEAASVLSAQAMMAEDPMLLDAVEDHLKSGLDLGDALSQAATELQAMLAGLSDPYLAARAADVGEVAAAVRRKLAGVDQSQTKLTEPSVLVAEFLTAAETADLDPAQVLGFVTEQGGPTGHVAIIARSLGVPAVVGVANLVATVTDGKTIAMDGSTGDLVLDPDEQTRAEFDARAERRATALRNAESAMGSEVHFAGNRVKVAANVGGADDIASAVRQQSDGVGLFRTEFLFLDRAGPPTEDEQFELYKLAASECQGQVVIRTFDIGGDKPAEFISLDEEENPFLGLRGVRIYDLFPDLFETQIRALYRASLFGDLAVMVPMVASADEIRSVRARIAEIGASMAAEEIGTFEVGVMVEVPSIALTAGAIASDVDFFSIGTNDLTQYTMAADRTHGSLGSYQNPLHPAVLKLCRETVIGAATANRSVSVCGEAAADPVAACIFAAIGVNKLSVTPSAVNLIKATVAQQSAALIVHVDTAINEAATAAEVRAIVEPHIVGL